MISGTGLHINKKLLILGTEGLRKENPMGRSEITTGTLNECSIRLYGFKLIHMSGNNYFYAFGFKALTY